MNYLTKMEAAARMNRLGKARLPFLFVVDYEQARCLVLQREEIDPEKLLYDIDGKSNFPADTPLRIPQREVTWQAFPQAEDRYAASFEKVAAAIHAGNSYLVNLTCATPIETNLTLPEIFFRASAKYRLWLRNCFVVFSPEIFVRMADGKISSFPMKGTIDAALPDACRRILEDPKEAAEHATIVDLIRNDLSMVATDVQVPRYRYVERLQTNKGTLLQVSSEVSGSLPAGWRRQVGDLLFALLPAGSVTGAPKQKTLEVIAAAESYTRGFYTGVMGYFDGERLDSAVMIRFVEQQPDGRLLYKSGGGITSRSNCRSEYNEMKQKVYVPIY